MSKSPFSRGDLVLPFETFAELMDGLTLAADALDGERLHHRDIEEARRHLRFAQRRASTFFNHMNGG